VARRRRALVWPWTEWWSWTALLVFLMIIVVPLVTSRVRGCPASTGYGDADQCVVTPLLGTPLSEILTGICGVVAACALIGLVWTIRQRVSSAKR